MSRHAHEHGEHGHPRDSGHDGGHDHDGRHGHGHGRAHHGHAHGHHHHGGSNETRLRWALIITAVFMAVEVVGGLVSGSLALIADAVHMLTDAASLLLALFALRVAKRPADALFSYGRARYEVLAAFVNGLALLGLSAWIIAESAQRLLHPQAVVGTTMLLVAGAGFTANLVTFLVLRNGEDSLNLRSAVLHVLADLLGSAAAMVAAVVILTRGWTAVDPILSAFVAVLILRGGWRVTKQSAHILLEGAPLGFQVEEVVADLSREVPGLASVHHVHAWSLTDQRPMMTLHAVLAEGLDRDAALAAIQLRLRQRFGVVHATVQLEIAGCAEAEPGCHEHGTAASAHRHAA